MENTIINSQNPLDSILSDLQLFQQTEYCKNFIKEKFPNEKDEKIEEASKISSACFRQANEFIISAQKASLYTNPLLYSYALNNFAKGLNYLIFIDDDMNKFFLNHGFDIKNEEIESNLLDTPIHIKNRKGAIHFFTKLYNDIILQEQEITFKTLLSSIPELSNIYSKTTHEMGNTAQKVENKKDEYKAFFYNREDIVKKKEMAIEYGITGESTEDQNIFYISFNMIGKKKYENNIKLRKNLFYKDYLIFPNKFHEGILSLNLMFYCYLIIMGYGMLVRYNAHRWEDFIDPKISNEYTLISKSVEICVNDFLYLLHQELFGYTYENIKYTDEDVKRVIGKSTSKIMNDITDKVEEYNLSRNANYEVPWPKNMR